MSRYVVTVKAPDDHPSAVRVFGAFATHAAAQTFADKINAAVEVQDGALELATGWAYVHRLHGPRVRPAQAWAMEGVEVPVR